MAGGVVHAAEGRETTLAERARILAPDRESGQSQPSSRDAQFIPW